MEDSVSVDEDSSENPPLDQPSDSGTEAESSIPDQSTVENTDSGGEIDQQNGNTANKYSKGLTWNFDTISGVLAVIFVALGTCIMYFQNSIKLGSYLLWIAIVIGLFNSFVRVYVPNFRSHKSSGNSVGNGVDGASPAAGDGSAESDGASTESESIDSTEE